MANDIEKQKEKIKKAMYDSTGEDFREVDRLEIAGELHNPDKRWEDGVEHHPKSERLMEFLADYDFIKYGDHFCWKKGGDGDNGETLMYQLDAFFEMLDKKGEKL